MINKKKKTRKLRGSRTHKYGMGKKQRGAGSRGGRGNAGSGKRGQQRETKLLAKGIKHLGKRGFKSKRKKSKERYISKKLRGEKTK